MTLRLLPDIWFRLASPWEPERLANLPDGDQPSRASRITQACPFRFFVSRQPHTYPVFIVLLLLFCLPADASMEGDFAPPFTLKDLRGKDVSLGDYKGKYLLINFWATWCTPCKIEMQSIEELYQRFRLEKFDVLAISNDMFGERVVKSYIKNRGFTFTVLLDPILTVSKQFGVVSLPTTFLVDPKGKVIGVLGGAEDWSAPRNIAFFQTLLDSKPEG